MCNTKYPLNIDFKIGAFSQILVLHESPAKTWKRDCGANRRGLEASARGLGAQAPVGGEIDRPA